MSDRTNESLRPKAKVAIVVTGLEVGGAETFLAELLSRRPDWLDVRVYQLIDGGPIADRIRAMGIEVTGLHMQAGRPSVRALMQLRRELKAFGPDIVHTWMYHADLLGGLAAKFAGVRHVIWHLHNSDLSRRRVRTMTRAVVRACAVLSYFVPNTIVSCSERGVVTHRAKGYSARKFLVIPNGVDTDVYAPDPSARGWASEEFGVGVERPLIGLIARVDPQKNHEGFFKAAKLFFDQGGDADFLLVGRDVTDEHWQLPGWRDATGRPERFVFAGQRADIPRIMAALDVATSSSLGEAFPLVLVEAMACGVPCVATDVGDSASIVGDTGFVVSPEEPRALATAWAEALALPDNARHALGARARARVQQNYSSQDVSRRIWELYERTLDK